MDTISLYHIKWRKLHRNLHHEINVNQIIVTAYTERKRASFCLSVSFFFLNKFHRHPFYFQQCCWDNNNFSGGGGIKSRTNPFIHIPLLLLFRLSNYCHNFIIQIHTLFLPLSIFLLLPSIYVPIKRHRIMNQLLYVFNIHWNNEF